MPAKPPATRKASRVKPDKAAGALTAQGDAERRGLAIFIRQTIEFRLGLALYNDPVARDGIIRSLAGELASEGIRVVTLDLREPALGQTMLARVEAVVKAAAVKQGERIAVMVVNLEGCVDYAPELAQPGGPGTEFLATANFHRELFPAACPGPLVIWMTELLERAVVRHAPDLWHWRSHVFDLRTRSRPRETADAAESGRMKSDDDRLHPEDRLRRLEEELAAYRKAGARFDEVRVLNAIGIARGQSGDARLARKDFEAALKLGREIGDRRGEGNALNNLGLAYAGLGDARKAIEYFEKALVISRQKGDRRGEGKALNNLGNAYVDLGEARTAIGFYEERLLISREIGDRRGEGSTLGNLGIAYADFGDARKAIEYYEKALVISREIGDRRVEGNALGNLGVAYKNLGDARKAIEFYEQQLTISREIGDRRGEGSGMWNSALVLDHFGEHARAIAGAEAALKIFEETEDPSAAKVRAKLAEWRGE